MAFWHTLRRSHLMGRVIQHDDWFRGLSRYLLSPTLVGTCLRLGGMAAIGVFVGLAVLAAIRLPPDRMFLVVGALMVPFMALMVGNLRRLFLFLIPIEIVYSVDVYLFYNDPAAMFGAIGGMNVSLTTIMLIGLYTLWFSQLFARQGSLAHHMPWISVPHAIYVATVGISMAFAYYRDLSVFELNMTIQSFLIFTYLVSTIQKEADIHRLVLILLGVLLIQGIGMVFVRLLRRSINLGPILVEFEQSTGRVAGTIGSTNAAASVINLMVPMAIVGLVMFRVRWQWLLALGAFVFSVLGLVVTQSRGGMLSFTIVMTAVCSLGLMRNWIKLTWVVVCGALFALPGLALAPMIFARFLRDDAGSASSRGPLEEMAWKMIADHPIFGIGANNFALVKQYYLTPEFGDSWMFIVHNQYLRIWSEMGTIGYVAYLALLVSILYTGWRCWHATNLSPFLQMLSVSLAAGMLGLIFHMNFDTFNGRNQVQVFWVISAIITIIGRMIDRNPSDIEPSPLLGMSPPRGAQREAPAR